MRDMEHMQNHRNNQQGKQPVPITNGKTWTINNNNIGTKLSVGIQTTFPVKNRLQKQNQQKLQLKPR